MTVFKKSIDCAIVDINVPKEWVWQTLTNGAHYSSWCDDIHFAGNADLQLEKGSDIKTHPPSTFSWAPGHTLHIEEAEPGTLLVWNLTLPNGLCFKLQRSHFLSEISDSRCQYSSMITLSGLASYAISPMIKGRIKSHLDRFDHALKAESERRYIHHIQTEASA